jgi:hypothetical protein
MKGTKDVSVSSVMQALQFTFRQFKDVDQRVASAVLGLIASFDDAPFLVRLRRSTGSWTFDDFDQDGADISDRSEVRITGIAHEVVADPALMKDRRVLDWLESKEAQKANTFFFLLGSADVDQKLFDELVGLSAHEGGESRFAAYFAGLVSADQEKARAALEKAEKKGNLLPQARLLATLQLPATLASVRKIERLMRAGSIDKRWVASLIRYRWTDPLDAPSYLRLLKSVAGGKLEQAPLLIESIYAWIHAGNAMTADLSAYAGRCLLAPSADINHRSFYYSRVASAIVDLDVSAGFTILRRALQKQNKDARNYWNPIDSHGENAFWDGLRNADRGQLYSTLFDAAKKNALNRFMVTWGLRTLIVGEDDWVSLTATAKLDRESALILAEIVNTAWPHFWSVAIELVATFPNDVEISRHLKLAVYGVGKVVSGPKSLNLRSAQRSVLGVLENKSIPVAVSAWLKTLADDLGSAAESALERDVETEIEDWQVTAETPSSPERLWGIRHLVLKQRFDLVRKLVPERELRRTLDELALTPQQLKIALESIQ